jgi:zinc transporter, ZIP family
VELPGWLQAAGWDAVSASGLLNGAVGGFYAPLQHSTMARTMTFAAGVLLAVVAVDLVINARGAASLHWTVAGMLCGAAVFSSVNWLLSQGGPNIENAAANAWSSRKKSSSREADWPSRPARS